MTSLKKITLCSVAFMATVGSAGAQSCEDNRYMCEPKPLVKPITSASVTPAAPAPKIAQARPATSYVAPVRSADLEKAPPDLPRAPVVAKRAQDIWAPIEIPSNAVQPAEGTDAKSVERNSISDRVQVVSADEVNEIDLAVRPVMETLSIKVVPIRIANSDTDGSVVSRSPDPVDTSLLERIFVTFGGAFGAASAFRIFFG